MKNIPRSVVATREVAEALFDVFELSYGDSEAEFKGLAPAEQEVFLVEAGILHEVILTVSPDEEILNDAQMMVVEDLFEEPARGIFDERWVIVDGSSTRSVVVNTATQENSDQVSQEGVMAFKISYNMDIHLRTLVRAWGNEEPLFFTAQRDIQRALEWANVLLKPEEGK